MPQRRISLPRRYGPIADHTDPLPDDVTLNGGEWLAQLIAAKVNWRMQATFGLYLPQIRGEFMRSAGPAACYSSVNGWYTNSSLALPDLDYAADPFTVLLECDDGSGNGTLTNVSANCPNGYPETEVVVACNGTNVTVVCSDEAPPPPPPTYPDIVLDCGPSDGNITVQCPDAETVEVISCNGTNVTVACNESVPLDDSIIPNTNGTKAPNPNNYSVAIKHMFVGDVIDVIEFFAYGSYVSMIVPRTLAGIDRVFAPGSPSNKVAHAIFWLLDAVHYRDANAIATWRLIISPLVAYNKAFRSCETNDWSIDERHCFFQPNLMYRQARPTGRPTAEPLPEHAEQERFCTFIPHSVTGAEAAFAIGDNANDASSVASCDCTGNATYEHYAAGRGHCLMECDPIAFPQFFGQRPTDCLLPGACTVVMATQSIENTTMARQVMRVLPSSGPPLRYAYTELYLMGSPQLQEQQIVSLAGLAPRLMAASLNAYYMRRYTPGLHLYMRTMDDPLYTRDCIGSDTDRTLWAGINVVAAVDVVNRTFFGDGKNMPCEAIYSTLDPRYAVCSRIKMRFPVKYGVDWGVMARDSIYPLLDLVNTFRPNCTTAGHQCFVASEFDGSAIGTSLSGSRFVPGPIELPPIDMVVPQYDALPVLAVKEIDVCSDMVSCVERTTCSVGRFGIVLGTIYASIATEINKAIQTGSGTWTLGHGFWELLKNVLGKLSSRLYGTLLSAVTNLDCVMCAVAGNEVGNILCSSPTFTLFRGILVLFDELTVTIVNFVVNLISNIINLIYYFFSGQFEKLIQTLFNLFMTLFVDLLWPLIKGLFGFLLGTICVCGFWNSVAGSVLTCSNMGWCDSKKRAAGGDDLAAYNATHLYELFAPGWWTAVGTEGGYEWPSEDACAAKMPQLAAVVSGVGELTETEGEVASYCLAKLTLYADAIARPYHRPRGASVMRPPDTCGRTIRLMNTLPERLLTDFDIATQSAAVECIWYAAVAHVARSEAREDTLAWVPDNFASPLAWLDMVGVASDAFLAHSERWRDEHYADAIVESPEYQESARAAFGEPRVALIVARAETKAVAPLEDYVRAVVTGESSGGDPSRKRSVDDSAEERLTRVTSMARLIDEVRRTAIDGLIDTMIAEVDRHMATLPPLFATVSSETSHDGTAAWTTTTKSMMQATTDAYESGNPQRIADEVDTTGQRLVHSGWQLFRHLYKGSRAPEGDAVATESRKRTTEVAAQVNGSFMGLLANGSRAFLGVMHEMWTGQARANATGDANATTSVAWKLTSHGEATSPTAAAAAAHLPPGVDLYTLTHARIAQATGKTFMAAMTERWAPFGDFVKRAQANPSPLAAMRAARVDMLFATSQHMADDVAAVLRGERPEIAYEAECPSWFELCEECLLLGEYYRMFVSIVMTVYEFYSGTNPRQESTIVYNLDAYLVNRVYLSNPNSPAIFGDSPSNSLLFPPLNGSILSYAGDNIPNKLRVRDMQEAFDVTLSYIVDLFSAADSTIDSFDQLIGIASTASATGNGNVGVDSAECYTDSSCHYPRPMSTDGLAYERVVISETRRFIGILQPLFDHINTTPAQLKQQLGASSTVGIASSLTLSDVASAWYDFLYGFVGKCSRVTEFDGSEVRFSIGEGLLIVGGGVSVGIVLGLVFPPIGDVLFGLFGATMATTLGMLVIAISGGWSIGCAPALPPLLFTAQAMQFLTTVVAPQCLLPMAPLVASTAYDNSNCMDYSKWRNGTWQHLNCMHDMGWTSILDLPVFLLRAFVPGFLTLLATPERLPLPFSLFFANDVIHGWLTRWDAVNLESDPWTYSRHWQCAAVVMPVPWFLITRAAFSVLTFGPTMAVIAFALHMALALVRTLGGLLIAFFGINYVILTAPMTMIAAAQEHLRKTLIDTGDLSPQ